MSDFDFLTAFTEAIKPIIREAVVQVLREEKSSDPDPGNDICGVGEAAKVLGISKATLYVHCSKAHREKYPEFIPPPSNKRGNKLYFSKKGLRVWMLSHDR